MHDKIIDDFLLNFIWTTSLFTNVNISHTLNLLEAFCSVCCFKSIHWFSLYFVVKLTLLPSSVSFWQKKWCSNLLTKPNCIKQVTFKLLWLRSFWNTASSILFYYRLRDFHLYRWFSQYLCQISTWQRSWIAYHCHMSLISYKKVNWYK